MPKTTSAAYAQAHKATQFVKTAGRDIHGNLDAIRTIWPLPEDPALLADLVMIADRVSEISHQIDQLRDFTADIVQKHITANSDRQRPGHSYTLKRFGQTIENTIPAGRPKES
jgi:hypothetical protein